MDKVSAESGPRLPVAAYCVHTSVPVLVPGVPQPVVTGRDEPYRSRRDRQTDVEPGIFTVIHTWGRDQQWYPHIHLSTTAGGVTSALTWKNLHFYARKVMSMWRYRITRLLSRKYPDLVVPDELAAEGSSRREWNHFLDSHYRRGWNVNVSRGMDNATHVAVYFGSYLKKPPVLMSRLEHYAGRDEIGLRYNSHRTKREEYLVMSGDEFMERFSWHVADKGFRMVSTTGS